MSAIRVELELDDGSFSSGLIHAGQSVDRFQRDVGQGIQSVNRMNEAGAGLSSTLSELTHTLGLAGLAIHNLESITTGWAGEIVKVNAEFERMTSLMRSLSTAADPMKEAVDAVVGLREAAKEAPFSLQAMHDAFVRLRSSGIDPTMETLHSLTDAVAAFGGTDETLHRASLAFQEMAGKGVVQMKELRNQLGMAVPNAIPLLARSMGVSYGQLMSEIHTGTVDAKAAIAALGLEFERTYGGAAQAQMQTFNGQIAKMKVALQDLAINNVGRPGSGGYFDAVKAQLTDFNNFLQSSTAQGLGDMLGSGLTSTVNDLRQVLDVVISLRGELIAAGEAWALVFGVKMVAALGTGLIGKIQSIRTEITMLGLAYEAMQNKMATASTLSNTVMMGAPMMSRWSAGVSTAGAAVSFLSTAVGTVLPWLLVLGPVVAAAAEYFGLFSDKNEEAYQSLLKFGAQTREEAQKGQDYVNTLKAQAEATEARTNAHTRWLDAMKRGEDAGPEPADGADTADLAASKKKVDDAQSKMDAITKQAKDAQAKTYTTSQTKILDEAFSGIERDYNAKSIALAKGLEANINGLGGKHSPDALDKQYQGDERNLRLEEYQRQEEAIQKLIDANDKLKDSQSEVDRYNAGNTGDELDRRMKRVQDQRIATLRQPAGVQLDAKVFDGAKAFERGQEALAKINDEIAGFSAGLDGVDPKVAELQSMLSRGLRFGDIGTDEVQDLIGKMVQARGEADALNDAMKGKSKLDHDLQALQDSLAERSFKANYGNLSETDQLIMKINLGMYKGVGPNKSAIETTLANVKALADSSSKAAGDLGTTLATKAFGGPAKTAADAMLETATKMAAVFGLIGTNVGSINGLKVTPQPSFGLTGPSNGDYFDKLIQRESSGRANAGANNPAGAVGLGQFMPATWDSFMRSQHPDMAGQGDQRTDPALSREAIAWYTAQNAQSLSGKRIDPTDANLYAAHFLGAGGAARVIQSDASTKFSDDPTFAKALAANPTILGNGATYGSLLAQFQQQFGNGHSGIGQPMPPAGSIDGKVPQLTNPEGLYPGQAEGLNGSRIAEAQTVSDEAAAKLREAIAKNAEDATKTADQFDETRKHWADMRAKVAAGTFGANKNPDDPIYKPLMDSANKADGNDKTLDDNKKARTKADDALEQARKQIEDQQAEHDQRWAQMQNPMALNTSSGMLRQKETSARNAASVKAAYGENSDQYKQILTQNAAAEDALRNNEITKDIDGLQKKTTSLRESLMTQEGARDDAYNKEVARIDKELAAFTGSETEKLALLQKRNDYVTAYAAKEAQASPLGQEFKQWSDITQNFQKNTANWLSSTTDSLSELIVTGKTNWASLTTSITQDIVKMGLQWGIGSLGGAAKTGVSSLFGSAAGGSGKLGVAHNATGDNNFAGGMTWVGEKGPELVSLPGGSSILPAGAVPAVAQQGAGSMQSQMAAATVNTGDTHQYNINLQPTLHATGGTSEQNADLARQMSAHVESSVRRVVSSELQKQMRPGNMLDGKNFT